MGNESDLNIVVRAKDEASRVLNDVQNKTKGFSKEIESSFKSAAAPSAVLLGAVTAVGAATAAFGVSSVKAFMESENAITQLEAAIKSTGGAAGVTSAELQKQATALQSVTKFSDEAVMATQAMLLTFTEIKGPIVKDATKAALDMAQALGMDGKQAAMQLGKALNDPLTGMTKLQRVGVTFTQAQKDQAAAMVQAGDVAGAQKLILQELQKEFGGSAEAAGTTFSGKLEILKNTFGDLQEAVGKMIVDALMPLANTFSDWLGDVQEAGGLMNWFKDIIEKNAPAFYALGGAIMVGLVPALWAAAAGMWAFFAPLLPFIAIGALIGTAIWFIVDALGGWDKVSKFLTDTWNNLMEVVQPIIDYFNAEIKPVLDIMIATMGDLIRDGINQLVLAFQQLQPWLAAHKEELKALGIVILLLLVAPFALLAAAVVAAGLLIAAAIYAVGWVINWLVGAAKAAWDWMKEAWAGLVGFFTDTGNNINNTMNNIGAYFGRLGQAAANTVNNVANWFRNLPGMILGAIGNAGNMLYGVGQSIVDGLVRGIQSVAGSIGRALSNASNDAVKSVKNILGIHSPSTVFAGIGENIGQGMIQGIEASKPSLMDAMSGMATADGQVISGQLATPVSTTTDRSNHVTNQFYGNISLTTPEAADRFWDRLNSDAELATVGVPI